MSAANEASDNTKTPVTPSDRLHNADLAPSRERSWSTYDLFAMWMSDVHSIGGYAFAAGLFFLGLVGWQVFAALVTGITAVFFLMNLTGFAGQQTGIPFPVIARISFGVFGANLAALIRAVIAIAWYGIQTWLASQAVVVLAISARPALKSYRWRFPWVVAVGLGRLPAAVGAAASRYPAWDGDRPQVPGLGRSRDLDRDAGRGGVGRGRSRQRVVPGPQLEGAHPGAGDARLLRCHRLDHHLLLDLAVELL
jgi:hypothetical protein